jgi:hypothetical protein
LTMSLYNNKILNVIINYYEKKRFKYKKSKLLYLRNKVNRESMVKTVFL